MSNDKEFVNNWKCTNQQQHQSFSDQVWEYLGTNTQTFDKNYIVSKTSLSIQLHYFLGSKTSLRPTLIT